MLTKNSLCREYTLHPFAAAEKTGLLSLNLYRTPQVSSSFLPDPSITDLFPDPQRFDILERCELDSKAIDELAISAPHFIKLEIQGGEQNALKGSVNTLQYTLCLEIEVEFLHLYKNQPLFGDVSVFCQHMTSFSLISLTCVAGSATATTDSANAYSVTPYSLERLKSF